MFTWLLISKPSFSYRNKNVAATFGFLQMSLYFWVFRSVTKQKQLSSIPRNLTVLFKTVYCLQKKKKEKCKSHFRNNVKDFSKHFITRSVLPNSSSLNIQSHAFCTLPKTSQIIPMDSVVQYRSTTDRKYLGSEVNPLYGYLCPVKTMNMKNTHHFYFDEKMSTWNSVEI